jgi:hypothetical protein
MVITAVTLYAGHFLVGLGSSWFGLSGAELPSLVMLGIVPLLVGLALLIRLVRVGVEPMAAPWRRNPVVASVLVFAVTACGVWGSWVFARDITDPPLTMEVTAKGFECRTSSGMYSDAGWLPTPLFTTLPCGMPPGQYMVTLTSGSHMLLSWRPLR